MDAYKFARMTSFMLVLLAVASMLPPSSGQSEGGLADPLDAEWLALGGEGPDIGEIYLCTNSAGDTVPFQVIDSSTGVQHSAWVLQEVYYLGNPNHEIRVGFNNQVPESTKAASLEITAFRWLYMWPQHERFEKHEEGVTSTGICGWGPAKTNGSTGNPAEVEIHLAVSGMTVTKTEAESETVSHTEWSHTVHEWGVEASVWKGGFGLVAYYDGTNEYGSSTHSEWVSMSSATWSSTNYGFHQDYQIPVAQPMYPTISELTA